MKLDKKKYNIIFEKTKISKALKILNQSKSKIIFVLNYKKKLVGSITDGDLRRSFLKGIQIHDFVSTAMNKNPKFVFNNELNKSEKIIFYLKKKKITYLPILNKKKKIVDIIIDKELDERDTEKNNIFVIMAGGAGKRLRPLTNFIPKPMIKIGKKPIIQYIIENALFSGFSNIYITVNYLRNKIQKYFKDGSKFGVKINYIIENRPLGTAGSLSLVKNSNNKPIIVVNGDTVTDINFRNLLQYHNSHNSDLTIATNFEREQKQTGIIYTKKEKVIDIIEKPILTSKINTGIYVVNKSIIKLIKKNTFFNMTDLIKKSIKAKRRVLSFPIYESWEDIGTLKNLKKIKKQKNFK